jgi:ABC-type Zn uptake system ZnuABC Zn-binding protein ZnuA
MLKAKKADVFISNGLELEASWESSIIEGSRNPKIKVGADGYLDASKGIHPLEIPQVVDRSMGDIHPLGNPHYLLDPMNAKIVAHNVAERLSKISPTQAEHFQKNLAEFNQRIDRKLAEWKSKVTAYNGEKIITYHKTWNYFASRFGLKIAGQLEPKPGIPPSASHLEEVIQIIKDNGVKVILQENFYNDDAARFVAERTGVHIIKAPISVGGAKEASDYFSLLDTIVEMITKGFSPARDLSREAAGRAQ